MTLLLHCCFEEEISRQQKKGADNSERDFSCVRVISVFMPGLLGRDSFFALCFGSPTVALRVANLSTCPGHRFMIRFF